MTNDDMRQPSAGLPPGVLALDGTELHDEVRDLAQQANFAAVSTLLSGGQPQTQLTWIDADNTHLLVNTLPFTQKCRNAARDPRVTVLVIDPSTTLKYGGA